MTCIELVQAPKASLEMTLNITIKNFIGQSLSPFDADDDDDDDEDVVVHHHLPLR